MIIESSHLNRILKTLNRLCTSNATGISKVRVGRDSDGGYVMLDDFSSIQAAYSLGIGDEISWDSGILARGIPVWQYDGHIGVSPDSSQDFHFFSIDIAAENGVSTRRLESLIAENDHDSLQDMILKCDIEGAEWPMLAEISSQPESCLLHFKQIVIELHGFREIHHPGVLESISTGIQALARHHTIIHLHANNCGGFLETSHLCIPETLETTWARTSDYGLVRPLAWEIPGPLDFPNAPDRPDYRISLPFQAIS